KAEASAVQDFDGVGLQLTIMPFGERIHESPPDIGDNGFRALVELRDETRGQLNGGLALPHDGLDLSHVNLGISTNVLDHGLDITSNASPVTLGEVSLLLE